MVVRTTNFLAYKILDYKGEHKSFNTVLARGGRGQVPWANLLVDVDLHGLDRIAVALPRGRPPCRLCRGFHLECEGLFLEGPWLLPWLLRKVGTFALKGYF